MAAERDLRVRPEEVELTGRIIGAAVTVHRVLGPGFLESIYHRSLERQLDNVGLRYESERDVVVRYDGLQVGEHRLDLWVEGMVVVELKAVSKLTDIHLAQVRSYLRATRSRIGLLLNFADVVPEDPACGQRPHRHSSRLRSLPGFRMKSQR